MSKIKCHVMLTAILSGKNNGVFTTIVFLNCTETSLNLVGMLANRYYVVIHRWMLILIVR